MKRIGIILLALSVLAFGKASGEAQENTIKYEASNVIDVNGVSLHYAVVGEGKPVVLVHGNGETHDLFDTEIRQLVEAGYKVYAPDSRGHGANLPLSEYHYADMGQKKTASYGFAGIIFMAYMRIHLVSAESL